MEEELQRQKVEVDARIRQLEQMRRDIASVLKDRVAQDDTQVSKLVDLYSSMKPKQAADVIDFARGFGCASVGADEEERGGGDEPAARRQSENAVGKTDGIQTLI